MKAFRSAFLVFLSLTGALRAQKSGAESTPQVTSLLEIKRIYIAPLIGGVGAASLRELIMASLDSSKLFVMTDNPDRADAILKGAADDQAFTDTFDIDEGLLPDKASESGRAKLVRQPAALPAYPLETMNLGTQRSVSMRLTHRSVFAIAMETSCGQPPRRAWAENFAGPARTWLLKSLISSLLIWTAHGAARLLRPPLNPSRLRSTEGFRSHTTSRGEQLQLSISCPEDAPFTMISSEKFATVCRASGPGLTAC